MSDAARLRQLIDAVPTLSNSDFVESRDGVDESIRFIQSAQAQDWLEKHPYWPKWSAIWWQLQLLRELGFESLVPRSVVEAFAKSVKSTFRDAFFESEAPADIVGDYGQSLPCPCQLGNLCLVLRAYGVDVDQTLPWARNWFVRYQMSDGGMSCDEAAYQASPQASSMVGVISCFEAMLGWEPSQLNDDQAQFIERAANHLVQRRLVKASTAPANASEIADEADWKQAAFPRFYFYDVLRGLTALVEYAKRYNRPIPVEAVLPAVESLVQRFPDGRIQIERQSYEGCRTLMMEADWERADAIFHPLLNRVSQIGRISPSLTREWARVRGDLQTLFSLTHV